jgi:prepilin-type N-terminal cleavage/methylation domain-containing protein
MKFKAACPGPGWRAPETSQFGFTLPEMLVSATVFTLLLGGVVGANLFGMRMYQVTQTKLISGDAARKTIGQLTDDIRACKSVSIGNVSNGVFVALLDGELQTGSGLIIYPTTNTANFIAYFLQGSDKTFRRTSSASGTTAVLAQGVTNTTVFSGQDYLGNILTNSQNNRVIHFDLEFFASQPQLPTADYYKLETSVTKRALE